MEAQERRTSQKDIAAYIVLKCSQVTCQVPDSLVVDLVCVHTQATASCTHVCTVFLATSKSRILQLLAFDD